MTNNQKFIAIAMPLLFSISINIYQYYKEVEYSKIITYYKTDQKFVDKAINLWSRKINRPASESIFGRHAISVHIRNETCVELRLNKGAIGGNPTYCFNNSTMRSTSIYDDVE